MPPSEDFAPYFERATGRPPYDYQRALGELTKPATVLDVPTGSGKTHALLVAWLHQRLARGAAPRRLVYALPMRTLVEQTATVARELRSNLGISEGLLPIHVLMGGESPADWRERPEGDQILVGTIDMLLSRALNRGYGESRFQWPVAFGLLNSDCRWVFDEVQLMGPARATSAQLAGLRGKLGVAAACETIWASATVDRDALITVDRPQLGDVLTLSAADRSGVLAERLEAAKPVERLDLEDIADKDMPQELAAAVIERHRRDTLSIVVVNRVQHAQDVFRRLSRALKSSEEAPELVLLHSRFRPPDRAARIGEALAPVLPGPGRIVVSTQVIEAGVDVSARLLVTETAPFSSIVQRLGRCNRTGREPDPRVLWVDRGELDAKRAAPYNPEELVRATTALDALEGESASPDRLARMHVEEAIPQDAVLRRRDLLDLFDTGPDLSGMDVDVSRFIRPDDERSVSVFFRELADDPAREPAPAREELVTVPLGATGERLAWSFDHVDGVWRPAQPRALRPGERVMLRVEDGGYDKLLGWTGSARDSVAALDPAVVTREEGIADDQRSFTREWMELEAHLAAAATAAQELAATLDRDGLPDGTWKAVETAAALHDIGKAHPVFQQTILASCADDAERERRRAATWAKSRGGRSRHKRRHFRHELASALALMASGGGPLAPDALAIYLVATHHGRVRLSIRPAPEEGAPIDRPDAERFALGIAEGDVLPAQETPLGGIGPTTLDLGCMELGGERSWTEAACALRDDPQLGPFRLAYLEALVQVADWRAGG